MLKMTGLFDEPAPSRNDGNKSASRENNNTKQASKKNNGNSEVDEFGGEEHTKKSRKSKGQKLAKS